MIELLDRLSLDTQRELLALSRAIVQQSPLYELRMKSGTPFHLRCASAGNCGWYSDEQGYRYVTTHPCLGQPFPDVPPLIRTIAEQSAAAVGDHMRVDTCLLNWYKPGDSLGLHIDRTEYDLSRPIVTISLGADAVFQIGGLDRDEPIKEIVVQSGDVLVFGGRHRLIWHGVKKVFDATLFDTLGMHTPGRISLTIRQVHRDADALETVQQKGNG